LLHDVFWLIVDKPNRALSLYEVQEYYIDYQDYEGKAMREITEIEIVKEKNVEICWQVLYATLMSD
jgi:hypothetical protein